MKTPDPPASARGHSVVSVVMANFNGGAYLADAIGSVQVQTLRDLEIIVSDDASIDNSVDIVTQLQATDPRIRLLRSDHNGGPAAARNRAIQVADGTWIAVVDSDDLIYPNRLKTLIEAAERDRADIVADDLLKVDLNKIEPTRRLLSGRWMDAPFWVDIVEYIRLNQMYGPGPGLGYLKPLFRASIFRKTATRYDESLKNSEDYDLVLRLLHSGKRMRVYPVPLYVYRKHSNSLSHRLSESALEALLVANRRFFDRVKLDDFCLRAAVAARTRSIEIALAYESLLTAMKSNNYGASLAIAVANPKAAALLRLAIGVRLRRLFMRLVEESHNSLGPGKSQRSWPDICELNIPPSSGAASSKGTVS